MRGNTITHTIKYFLGAEAPWTQTSEKERLALSNLAKGKSKVLEIGVFEGHSTKILAESMNSSGELYAMDPFFKGMLGFSYRLQITKNQISNVRRVKSELSVKIIRDFSYNAAKDSSLTNFDLIFIDRDHSLEGITKDWNDWSHRVRPHCFIALHDTRVPEYDPSVSNLGSHQYSESYIKNDSRFTLVEQIDSLSVLQKN